MKDENEKKATTQQTEAERTANANKGAGFSKGQKRLSPPPYFLESRQVALYEKEIEKQVQQLKLFKEGEENKEGKNKEGKNKVTIPKGITAIDFYAVRQALSILLYNQSYLYGNEKILSGIEKQKKGEQYTGIITLTTSDIAKYGYGDKTPNLERRKKIEGLLDTFHNNPFRFVYSNGKEEKNIYLCSKLEETKKPTQWGKETIEYKVVLNPIFSDLGNGYNLLPQDIAERMAKEAKKLTESHYLIVTLIAKQQGSFSRYIDTLAEELNLTKEYKVQRKKAERKIIELCEIAVKCGIIKKYIPTWDVKTKKLTQVTFIKEEKKEEKKDEKKQS